METIFDELKQFIVKKVNVSKVSDFEIGKEYLLCYLNLNGNFLNTLVMIREVDIYDMNNCGSTMVKPYDMYEIFEFEHTFNSNKFIEIFLRIVANNDCDDCDNCDNLAPTYKKIILENTRRLFYKKYDAIDECYYTDKQKSIFHKKAKLNGIDYFNDKYRIYFYV